MLLPPKICPSCRDEFVHAATFCAECDVELVLPENLSAAVVPTIPPASDLTCVRVAASGWSLGLAERLVERDILHRVELMESGGSAEVYGVFVLPEDVEVAREIDAEHARREMPDLPDGFDPQHMMARPAPLEEEASEEVCPACGDPIDDTVTECAGCGLFLAAPE
jgi:hypothetical protein